MPLVLTKTENENDSANQNDIAKMMSQCCMETAVVLCTNTLIGKCYKTLINPLKMANKSSVPKNVIIPHEITITYSYLETCKLPT